jgi:hypothetical protein
MTLPLLIYGFIMSTLEAPGLDLSERLKLAKKFIKGS